MTGSVHDAEDLVQETYLRAWRAYHGFEGRSSVRTWLYRIATNVCLTALEGRNRRPLPAGLGAPSSEAGTPLEENGEIPWLEPVPDAMLDEGSADDPLAVVTDRETIRLAFVAALQHLPARQRAVLILRDVLRWKAAEVAEAMETTTASVNSALQRAHATLEKANLSEDSVAEPTAEQKAMLDRYVDAFWRKDIESIVSMLTKDAVWEMPPFTGWYQGAANIGRLIDSQCPGGVHDMRMLQTRANGQPAFGLYMRGDDGGFHPVPPAGAHPRAGRRRARRRVLRGVAVRDVRAAGVADRRRRAARAGHGGQVALDAHHPASAAARGRLSDVMSSPPSGRVPPPSWPGRRCSSARSATPARRCSWWPAPRWTPAPRASAGTCWRCCGT